MRIFLKLKSTKNCDYDLKYFHKLQGFVYRLLRDTDYGILHDKKGYKFFCFSNIFPIGNVKVGEERNLIISSPDRVFIKLLEEKIRKMMDDNAKINIGEYEFEIEDVSTFRVKLRKNINLVSATPIVVRIPEKNYERYNIPVEFRKRRYVYWRPQYSFEAFLKQLEENLIKKYNEFHKTDFEIESIFEVLKFDKPVVNHVIIKGKEKVIIGSIWQFQFSYLNLEQKKILEFGIDAGFGERNSLGFGFMNVME
jgi:CRISPR-associated endoribonuclease Cas6